MAESRLRVADWLGIPFRPHQATREGCDCLGLCRLVLGAMGHDLDPYRDAWRQIAAGLAPDQCTGLPEGWTRIERGEVGQNGDLLLFRSAHGDHLGVVMEGYMISTNRQVGSFARALNRLGREPEQCWRRPAA